jgi:hypothetical protein
MKIKKRKWQIQKMIKNINKMIIQALLQVMEVYLIIFIKKCKMEAMRKNKNNKNFNLSQEKLF